MRIRKDQLNNRSILSNALMWNQQLPGRSNAGVPYSPADIPPAIEVQTDGSVLCHFHAPEAENVSVGYTHEADIFANQSKYVRPLTPYDIFTANIEAGNQEQLIIKELVESYGLSITPGDAPGGICAVATIQDIMKKFG